MLHPPGRGLKPERTRAALSRERRRRPNQFRVTRHAHADSSRMLYPVRGLKRNERARATLFGRGRHSHILATSSNALALQHPIDLTAQRFQALFQIHRFRIQEQFRLKGTLVG